MADIIGVVGFIGSGKNTVGNFLIDTLGYTSDSFAGPLKDVVAAVFGWDREMIEGEIAESRSWRTQPDTWWEKRLDWSNNPLSKNHSRFTPRLALQLWGTDVLRKHFNDDIWVASLEYRMRGKDRVVITDCRFPNELKTIRNLGGKILRIRKGPEPDWYQTALAANSKTFLHSSECFDAMVATGIHISEWAWIGEEFDAVIDNNGTLDQLKDTVKWTLQNL